MTRWLVAVVLLCIALPAMAQVQVERPTIALSPAQEARYRALLPDLRCLVCQNESIADSTAPLAMDLRYQVREQLVAGRSDAEIKHYLTDRYGDFVLFRPPFQWRTGLLWLGPFVLVGLALLWLVAIVRRSRQSRQPAPTVDESALRRLLEEPPPEDAR